MAKLDADVIVVGGGNAAFSAALAAQEQGASVLMLEAAPEDESGGNSRFTAGSVRVVYNGVDDIKALVPDLTEQEIADHRFRHLHAGAVLRRHGAGDAEPRRSRIWSSFWSPAASIRFCWMRDKGVRFIPIYGRQAFKIDGKFKFWGGLTVEAVGGGPGLIKMLTEAATKRGIEIRYETRALSSCLRRRPRARRAHPARRRRERIAQQIGRARLRRVRIQCRMAHALSRPRLGPRQGARHALQHRRRHPHGAGYRRQPVRQLVGLPCGAMGDERARIRRSRGRRPVPEALLSVRASWSTPPASASSTKAPISATTPMPNTAAWCWSSRGQFAWQIFDQKVKHLQRDEYTHPADHQGASPTRSRNSRTSSRA